jgi:NAD-dependent deacetylase
MKYIIDVKVPETGFFDNLKPIEAKASIGTAMMSKELIEKYA